LLGFFRILTFLDTHAWPYDRSLDLRNLSVKGGDGCGVGGA
jgi:hypothetical protein